MADTPNKEDKQQQSPDHAMQPRCIDIPNDEPEAHYWSWVNAPRSVPNQYRECMTCGRIDATEWLESRENHLKEDLKVVGGEDEELRKKLAMYVAGLAESGDNFMKPEMVSQEVRTSYVDSLFRLIKSRDQRIALEARIDENEAWRYSLQNAGLHEPGSVTLSSFSNRIAILKQSRESATLYGIKALSDNKVPENAVRFDYPDGKSEGFIFKQSQKEE